jgi:hypothetical protein
MVRDRVACWIGIIIAAAFAAIAARLEHRDIPTIVTDELLAATLGASVAMTLARARWWRARRRGMD